MNKVESCALACFCLTIHSTVFSCCSSSLLRKLQLAKMQNSQDMFVQCTRADAILIPSDFFCMSTTESVSAVGPVRIPQYQPPPPPVTRSFPTPPVDASSDKEVKTVGTAVMQWIRSWQLNGEREKFLLAGVLMWFVICMIPIYGAIRIWTNTVYSYFVGDYVSELMIAICVGMLIFYLFTVWAFFTCGRDEEKTEDNLLAILLLTSLLLGVGLLIMAYLYSDVYGGAVEDMSDDCMSWSKSGTLYDEYQMLLAIRETDSCKDLVSVTLCDAYNASDYSEISMLETIEATYMCAGYCDSLSSSDTTTTSLKTKANKLNSEEWHNLRLKLTKTSLLQSNVNVSHFIDALSSDTKPTPKMSPKIPLPISVEAVVFPDAFSFPPTLFSLADYQTTCTAQLIHDFDYNLGSVATFLYVEALCVVFVAIVIAIYSLYIMCRGDGEKEQKPLLQNRHHHHHHHRSQRNKQAMA